MVKPRGPPGRSSPAARSPRGPRRCRRASPGWAGAGSARGPPVGRRRSSARPSAGSRAARRRARRRARGGGRSSRGDRVERRAGVPVEGEEARGLARRGRRARPGVPATTSGPATRAVARNPRDGRPDGPGAAHYDPRRAHGRDGSGVPPRLTGGPAVTRVGPRHGAQIWFGARIGPPLGPSGHRGGRGRGGRAGRRRGVPLWRSTRWHRAGATGPRDAPSLG